MPPQWMWHLDWELEAHFEHVKNERDKKYNSSPSPDSAMEQPESIFDENVYASRFKD